MPGWIPLNLPIAQPRKSARVILVNCHGISHGFPAFPLTWPPGPVDRQSGAQRLGRLGRLGLAWQWDSASAGGGGAGGGRGVARSMRTWDIYRAWDWCVFFGNHITLLLMYSWAYEWSPTDICTIGDISSPDIWGLDGIGKKRRKKSPTIGTSIPSPDLCIFWD